jgi:murein DD-endopeptidase MepM/ murein hydrolase activator NlpD
VTPVRRSSAPHGGRPMFGAVVRPARAVAPPLCVALLAAFVVGLLSTGHAAAGGLRPVAAGTFSLSAPASSTGRAQGDVARALSAFAAPGSGRRVPAASRTEVRLSLHRWVRPNGGPLTSSFGMRWGRMHEGIDLAGPYGSPILAATAGCITYAGPMAGYGEVMQISDWDGTQTVYGHMSSFVRHSGCVKPGEVIARVGSGGDATGPHLHFEVRVGGSPVDPIRFLAKRGLLV